MKTLIPFLLFLLFPAQVPAMEQQATDNCHCFKNRSYNPEKIFASDPYLLTTCFNSLLSSYFKISKSQLIMKKMKEGIAPDDLIIGLYLARESHTDLDLLLATMNNGGSWQQILASEKMKEMAADNKTLAKISQGEKITQAAKEIIGQMIADSFQLKPEKISAHRQEGLSEKEIILLYTLANYQKQMSFEQILAMKKNNGMSWSQIADTFGLSPKETGRLLLVD